MDWIGSHFVASDSTLCMIGGAPTYNTLMTPNILAGVTDYSSLFGAGNAADVLDRSSGLVPYDLGASMFTNHVTASSAAATFTLLKNGSSSGLAVSALSGHTGYFMSGPTDSVAFAKGDTCANEIQVVGTTGSTSITWVGAALLLTADT